MKIYQVGPDVPYDLPQDDDRFEWIVYDYRDGGYDGEGEAVGLNKEDGLLWIRNLSHCSCYGPFDGGMEGSVKMTVEEFLKKKDNIHDYDATEVIKSKVLELLSCKASVFNESFNFFLD